MAESYAENLAELEAILNSMRSDSCDIDTLASKTRRAAELLATCRARLTATEEELNQILDSLTPPGQ